MELITDLINSVKITLDSINRTIKKYQSKSKVSSDRKLQIAIKTAKEIISTYDAVQRGIEEALKEHTTYYDMANGNYRPRYRYWTEFCPDVAIGVLHTLDQNYSHEIAHLIQKLEAIVRPFRAHQPEQVQVRSLGIKPYKFNSYAVWHNSFSDHGMSYALWRECGFK
jgi:hypothetical protein